MHHSNHLSNLRRRKLSLLLDLTFLKRCRNQRIIPNFINKNYKSSFHSHHMKKQDQRHKLNLLRASIKDIRSTLAKVERMLYVLHSDLMFYYHPIAWDHLDKTTWAIANSAVKEKELCQENKFHKLQQQQHPRARSSSDHNFPSSPASTISSNPLLPSSIINLSSLELSAPMINILELGLNFAHYVPKSCFLRDLLFAVLIIICLVR